MVSFLVFAFILGLLVFVHELGHFLAAKKLGVGVEEFGFGYPPRLFSFWRTNGKVIIGGKEIVIPRGFELPDGLSSGSLVIYETDADKDRWLLTRIEEVDADDPAAARARWMAVVPELVATV